MAHKRYVEMIVRYLENGTILPLAVRWTEGQLYEIDRILDVCPCVSLKSGGARICYICRIQGHEKYIWREDDRWFVEAKDPKECIESS